MCNTQFVKYQLQNKKKYFMVELVTTAISLFHLNNKTEKQIFQIRTAAFRVKAHQRKKSKIDCRNVNLGCGTALIDKNTARLVPL